MQRAAIHLDMGDYEGAVADCDKALKIDPNLAAAHVARARGECELGEIDHAILDCDSAIHLDEKLIEAYVIRAKARLEKASEMRTLAEVAECEQAVDDCQTAIELSKNPRRSGSRETPQDDVRPGPRVSRFHLSDCSPRRRPWPSSKSAFARSLPRQRARCAAPTPVPPRKTTPGP